MGEKLRTLALVAGLLAVALPAAVFAAPAGDGEGADKTKSAQLVQQIFDGGIKAYGVGKYEEAMRAFEAAIRTGMPSHQMPRVLYYRGLTFRKLGKPGFAVSDLTSALWLKGGLSEAERADAMKNRALAYHESGVSEVPPLPKSAYAEAPAMPGQSNGGAQVAASSQAAAPAAPSSSSGSGGGIGGFFSNLFGGGSSSESAEPAPASTASIASTPASGGWGASTEVIPSGAAASAGPSVGSAFVTQVAAVEEPSGASRQSSVGGSGGITLQVASVRSRSEAESLAGLLVGRHGSELGGRKPAIDESVVGSMGTFYRVRLGPFSNSQESGRLCNSLRSDGFDCLVVTE